MLTNSKKGSQPLRNLFLNQLEERFNELMMALNRRSGPGIPVKLEQRMMAFAVRANQAASSGNEVGLIACINEASMYQGMLSGLAGEIEDDPHCNGNK